MEQIVSVEETQIKDKKCILLRIKGGKQFVLQCEVRHLLCSLAAKEVSCADGKFSRQVSRVHHDKWGRDGCMGVMQHT